MAAAPDLIVTGARIAGTRHDGVTVSRGHVGRVGDARALADPSVANARVLHVPGGLVCPGFHDAHVHLHAMAEAATEIPARTLGVTALLAHVRNRSGPHDWIVFADAPDDVVSNDGLRAGLDAVAPHTPVLVRSRDHHTCRVNGEALRRLERPVDGSGLLREAAAFDAAERSRRRPDEQRRRALRSVLDGLLGTGVTAAHEMSGGTDLRLLRDLARTDGLPLDVYATLSPDTIDAPLPDEPRLCVAGVKVFLDGALGSRTAALLAPYEDDAEPRLVDVLSPDAVCDIARHAADRGLPTFLHAIGDRAVRTALDCLSDVRAPDGSRLRHRIEHAQTVHPDDLTRFATHGIVASVQPAHIHGDAPLVRRLLGNRSARAFPLRALLDAGARMAFGSDAPVTAADPLRGIRAAADRSGGDGAPLHAEHALSVAEALAATTSGAAFAAGRDDHACAVRPGMRASLTILSHDVVDRPETLPDARVVATLVDGVLVYDATR